MGAHEQLDSILDAERAEAAEWPHIEPDPEPVLDPPTCLCGHDYLDHTVWLEECDIDECGCDSYRANP